MVRTKWPDDEIHTCVCSAPAIGGNSMYEIELGCFGEHTRMFKNKSEFRDLLNVFQLNLGPRDCSICSTCTLGNEKAKIARGGYMAKDLDVFLETVLKNLKAVPCEAIQYCSHHLGIVRVLMEFLSIRDERCFATSSKDALKQTKGQAIIAPCTLSRSLSDQFANFESLHN